MPLADSGMRLCHLHDSGARPTAHGRRNAIYKSIIDTITSAVVTLGDAAAASQTASPPRRPLCRAGARRSAGGKRALSSARRRERLTAARTPVTHKEVGSAGDYQSYQAEVQLCGGVV